MLKDLIPNWSEKKISLREGHVQREHSRTYVRTEATIFRIIADHLCPVQSRYSAKMNESESCTRLKNVVQNTRTKKTGPRVELQSNEKVMREAKAKTENKEIVICDWLKGHCSKGYSCSSKHQLGSKGNAKGKRDRPRSLSAGHRSPRCQDF